MFCETGNIEKIETGEAIRDASGAAMILMNEKLEGSSINLKTHFLPTVCISYVNGPKIKAYINSLATLTVSISFEGTIIRNDWAPSIAYFPSKGPNPPNFGILKPYIIGPDSTLLQPEMF